MPSATRWPVEALERHLGRGRLLRDVPLARYTTFKIGGPVDLFFRARTVDELVTALGAARELGVPTFLLGMGANILVGDRGIRGLVVRNETSRIEFLDDTRVRADSGVLVFHDLIQATVQRGLGGLHHFVGIPSTVGGALWQNLHFLSPPPARERTVFIGEVTEACDVLTEDGQIRTLGREELAFGYDDSVFHHRPWVALRATFRLQPQNIEDLRYVIRENLAWRDERHPDLWLYPCAGSIFKKIEGVGAGRLIDQVGLKGYVLGNAAFFHKHANIIVNLGGATAADVRALMALAQERVARQLGYQLEPEIVLVGEF
jgi:UDP-N-acetylmuramate dehydrogenase